MAFRWLATVADSFQDRTHATQIVIDRSWSLLDVVAYTILMLKTGAEWWEALHYFGDAIFVAELSVQNLELRGSARTIHQVVRP